jgi:hypothetical protein
MIGQIEIHHMIMIGNHLDEQIHEVQMIGEYWKQIKQQQHG